MVQRHSFGYTQDSRLVVMVLRWCYGSELKDQNMWRMSGIFCDVNLLYKLVAHLSDICILRCTTTSAATNCRNECRASSGATASWCGEKNAAFGQRRYQRPHYPAAAGSST